MYPSSDEYVGRSPQGMRAGLGAARRTARLEVSTAYVMSTIIERSEWRRKKPQPFGLGLQCLIAVITLRHLLREVKQGMTTSRLSFAGQFS